ncbi:MAG TPA: hypothetical protein DCY07_08270 [Rhodospirillaceae bacterium]|nr:hypothetical protein [Rhodospirillaceae bacterium]
MDPDQSSRHQANFVQLLKVSENAALFLPNVHGIYVKPAFLDFIRNGRIFVGGLNQKKGGVYRKSSLWDVQTPECAHGLGVTHRAFRCKNVVAVTTKVLAHSLARFELPPAAFPPLATKLIASTLYPHDTSEDAKKYAKKLPDNDPLKAFFESITPAFVAQAMLDDSSTPHAEKLLPILTAYLTAFTDDAKYEKRDRDERIAAQQIPPRIEHEVLTRLGIIDGKDPWFFGLITAGKYCDKKHQSLSDKLVVATGRKSIHKDADSFWTFANPRAELIDGLPIPPSHKSLFHEDLEETVKGLKNPLKKPLSEKQALDLIDFNLRREAAVYSGRSPHIPLSSTRYYDLGYAIPVSTVAPMAAAL